MSPKVTKSVFDKVEEFVKVGDFQSALNELRSMDNNELFSQDSPDYVEQQRRFAAIYYYLGDYVRGLSHCERGLFANRGSESDMELYGKLRLIQGLLYQRVGNLVEGGKSASEAYLAFRSKGDIRSQILARNAGAMMLLDGGALEEAVRLFNECATDISIHEYPDLYETNIINRTYALNRLGKFKRALSLHKEAQPKLKNSIARRKTNRLAEIAFAKMHLGQFESAEQDLEIVFTEATMSGLRRETILYYEYAGLLNLLQGKYADCEAKLKKGLDLVPEIASTGDMVSQINRLLAELELARGNWQIAREYAEAGMKVARKITERVEIGATLRCIAESAVETGDRETAERAYTESIQLYREYPHGYEQSRTFWSAAESGALPDDLSLALAEEAENYFTAEEVNIRTYRTALFTKSAS